MIETADKYEEQLKNLKPVDGDEWYYYTLPLNVICQRLVSTYQGEVIGSINLLINLPASTIVEISIISYTEKYRFTFGKDVMRFIRYLMQKYRKCSFFFLIGCSAETSYERITKHLGWKIVGIMEKQVLNNKGEWNDIKMYEYVNPNWRPRDDSE
jgi:hypothetical protein